MQPLSSAVSHGKELYNTNSPSASSVTVMFTYVCVCHVLLRLLFEGGVLSKKYGIIITMTFVRVSMLLQLLLSTKNLTSRELKARNSLHFCLTKKKIPPFQRMI